MHQHATYTTLYPPTRKRGRDEVPPLERKYFSKKYVFFTVKVVFIIKIVKKVKQAIDFFTISYILYIENFIFRDIVEK